MSSPTTQHTDSRAAGHETRDVDVRAILWFGMIIAAGTLAVAFLILALLRHYNERARRGDPELPPLAGSAESPRGPHLQATPIADYEAFHEEQEKLLSSYGWVDRQQGIVRIPVERAMDIVLERGLPTPGAAAAPSDGAEQPTASPITAEESAPSPSAAEASAELPAVAEPANPPPNSPQPE